jgi:uncharacterized protein (TIGR03437 family)
MKSYLVYACILLAGFACSKSSNPPPPPVKYPPTITGFTPTSGTEGATISISGDNLTTVTLVKFNGVSASFKMSGSNIQADVPSGASTGKISVTNPDGSATSADVFNVIAKLPAPEIDSLMPNNNPVNWPVLILGKNLDSVVKVSFGGINAEIDTNFDGQIATVVPNTVAPGLVNLIITNNRGVSDTVQFTVLSQPPFGQPSENKIVYKGPPKYIPRVTDNWFNEADPNKNYWMHLDTTGNGTENLNDLQYPLTSTFIPDSLRINVVVHRDQGDVRYTGTYVDSDDPNRQRIIFITEEGRQIVVSVSVN